MADPRDTLARLQRRLGYEFRDLGLLERALTHSSVAQDGDAAGGDNNERLEFLGDAVVKLRVSEQLLAAHPGDNEGELTRRRAAIESAPNLAAVAGELGLGEALRMGRAMARRGGRENPRLLANALEAVIAAIHLDGGYAAAAACVDRWLVAPSLGERDLGRRDHKSALQEWCNRRGLPLPVYQVLTASGPAHQPWFAIEVVFGEQRARGEGASKRAAEQAAAEAALRQLE